MLNQSRVLKYIKMHLGFPFQALELNDEDIIDYFTEYTLSEFSYYVPDKEKFKLDMKNAVYQVSGTKNEYYIEDSEGLEILNVIDIMFPAGDMFYYGHPPFGYEFSGNLTDWVLSVESAMTKKMFSTFDVTYEFKQPNIVRISPANSISTQCLVEYERIQPKDLRKIPADFYILFSEFALADIQIVLGRIRKKYADGNLRHPYGEIPLSADILEEGKDKRREIIEKLERLSLPNVVIDHG